MFEQVLDRQQLLLIDKLSQHEMFSSEYYLAGGTALALQFGHRKSQDLDFFAPGGFDVEKTRKLLNDLGGEVMSAESGAVHAVIDAVKLSVLRYDFPLLQSLEAWRGIQVASVPDVVCMKCGAVAQGSEKKDFFDVYEALKYYGPYQLRNFFVRKYQEKEYNGYHILRSFFFFDDAEDTVAPTSVNGTEWEDIKHTCVRGKKKSFKLSCRTPAKDNAIESTDSPVGTA